MSFPISSSFTIYKDGHPIEGELLRANLPEIAQFIDDWESDNHEIELQTSGSTGVPKIVRISKSILVHSARTTIHTLSLPQNATALLALPINFIAGKMMLVRALVGGWKLHVMPPTSDVLEHLPLKLDFAALVPLQVQGREHLLNQIGTTIIGGAPIPLASEKKLSTLNTQVFATYGMTETVSHIALRSIAPQESECFEAVKGVSFQTNENGALIIRAPKWNQSKLETTDVVELVDDSTFIWKGRLDFVINSGGVKIHPEQVEPLLSEHLGQLVYIKGVPDEQLGTRVVGITEFPISQSNLESLDKDQFPKYSIPKEWEVKSFPRTDNGKIKRREL